MAKPKRPRDPNQLAKLIVDISTGQVEDAGKIAAEQKGRLGGLKGGTARAKALTPDERSKIATLAAQARWKKQKR